MRDATFSLKHTVPFTLPQHLAGVRSGHYASRPAMPAFHDSYGYYPGAEFVQGGPVPDQQALDGQALGRERGRAVDRSSTASRLPGYNGTDALPLRLHPPTRGPGAPATRTPAAWAMRAERGNPGDIMGQYGWHVQILDQTDQVVTVKVWNSIRTSTAS